MRENSTLLQSVRAQTIMELRLSLRRGESVLLTLIVPPVLLVFLGSIGPISTVTESSLDALVPGIVTLAVISSAMVSLGIATAFERYYGVLKRLGSTPLPRSGLIAAKIGSVLLIEVLQVAILAAIASGLLHWTPGGTWWAAIPAILIGTCCFASLGLLMAGTLRAETTLALANGLYLLFLLGGGLVVPIEVLPGWLHAIGQWLPAYALDDMLTTALVHGAFDGSVAILLFWAVLFLAATVRLFRWD